MDRGRLNAWRVVNTEGIGRTSPAWRIDFGDESPSWICDVGGGNPQLFDRNALTNAGVAFDESLDPTLFILELEDLSPPGGPIWPAVNDLAADDSFPDPVATFRAGRVWVAQDVRDWQERNLLP